MERFWRALFLIGIAVAAATSVARGIRALAATGSAANAAGAAIGTALVWAVGLVAARVLFPNQLDPKRIAHPDTPFFRDIDWPLARKLGIAILSTAVGAALAAAVVYWLPIAGSRDPYLKLAYVPSSFWLAVIVIGFLGRRLSARSLMITGATIVLCGAAASCLAALYAAP